MIRKTSPVVGFMCLILCLSFLNACRDTTVEQAEWPHIALSKDGMPITYEVYGAGEPALVFVHGWSCDSRYWREQIPYFSKKHRIVILDLAGHGHSGMGRKEYTMRSFGEDVLAVTEAVGAAKNVLVGHSMGGTVIAEAARLMPDRVLGLIGVETLENIEYPLNQEALDGMIAPLREDFKTGSRQFVESMMLPQMDAELRNWILSDMASAPPDVALSAVYETINQFITGEAASMFDEIKVPVIVVNGDMNEIDYEANRRHMHSFDAIILENADHFLMMNRPDEFNRALEKAISMLAPE